MDITRWEALMHGLEKLTNKEVIEGWHFCDDWDYLLIGPEMDEYIECCVHKRNKE